MIPSRSRPLPAPLALLRAGSDLILSGIVAAWRAHRRQVQLRRLLDMDARSLDDVGISRDDVLWVQSQPEVGDPFVELDRMRRARHRRMMATWRADFPRR